MPTRVWGMKHKPNRRGRHATTTTVPIVKSTAAIVEKVIVGLLSADDPFSSSVPTDHTAKGARYLLQSRLRRSP